MFHLMQGNPRQSWIKDSSPWIPDSRYWITDSLSVKLGSRIPIVTGILDSLSCFLDFKVQGSGFYKQNFFGFRILEEKISWI